MKRQSGLKRFTTVFILLLLITAFILFPFYWAFVTPVKPQDEPHGAVVTYWPGHITFEAYSKLFTTIVNFFAAMKNSFIVASLTTIVSLITSMSAACASSRYQPTERKTSVCTFLCNNMFSTVLLLVPLYTIMHKMGLLCTPTSLVLSYTAFTIPFPVQLLLDFLNNLPVSFKEATLMDGCNRSSASLKIILPVLGPCLATTGAYILMTSRNEYTFAMIFTSTDTRIISVVLKSLIGQLGIQWGLLTTGGTIATISVYVVFFFTQERLVEGLTAGAVKG